MGGGGQVAGRLHISAANRFTSLKVTAWTNHGEESYGKYGSDVERKARVEGRRGGEVERWRGGGCQPLKVKVWSGPERSLTDVPQPGQMADGRGGMKPD